MDEMLEVFQKRIIADLKKRVSELVMDGESSLVLP